MIKHFALWKKETTEGCLEDDGGDSRTYKTTFIIVPFSDEVYFGDLMCEDYSSQDYSYQVEYTKIYEFDKEELESLKSVLDKTLEIKKNNIYGKVHNHEEDIANYEEREEEFSKEFLAQENGLKARDLN